VKGVEPAPKTHNCCENSDFGEPGGVKAALPLSVPMPDDQNFLSVALAWPKLPDAIKMGIAAMVKAVS
jgi:hypothetical protein